MGSPVEGGRGVPAGWVGIVAMVTSAAWIVAGLSIAVFGFMVAGRGDMAGPAFGVVMLLALAVAVVVAAVWGVVLGWHLRRGRTWATPAAWVTYVLYLLVALVFVPAAIGDAGVGWAESAILAVSAAPLIALLGDRVMS